MLKEKNQAEPSSEFTSFHLNPRIEAAIRASGYIRPTPVQCRCIPPILERRDVMGLAQTGTGKTAAYLLPILNHLLTGPRKQLRAMIIAPTRELADQIQESVYQLRAGTKLDCVTLYGGVNKNPQIKKLQAGVEIAVACPGRLLDLMNQGEVKTSALEMLVLDEADMMLDMGFLPDIRKIMKQMPAKRQTLLFSATMPDEIRQLGREFMEKPLVLRVDDTRPAVTVSHALYPVAAHLKTPLLMRLLDKTDTESVLVFTRTRHRAKRLAGQMKNAGFGATSLQGDLPQTKRQQALQGFRDGRYQILIATDIAARGIDVSSISHVINYDMPDTVDAYTHRIGRTGRAERTGDAFSFATKEDQPFVWAIERALGESLEKRTIEDFNYSVPAPVTKETGNAGNAGSAPRRHSGSRPANGNPSKTPGRPSFKMRTRSSAPKATRRRDR